MTGGNTQISPRGETTAGGLTPAMRFSVDGWDPTYGTSMEFEEYLDESTASVEVNVELPAGQWRAIDPDPGRPPPAAAVVMRCSAFKAPNDAPSASAHIEAINRAASVRVPAADWTGPGSG